MDTNFTKLYVVEKPLCLSGKKNDGLRISEKRPQTQGDNESRKLCLKLLRAFAS